MWFENNLKTLIYYYMFSILCYLRVCTLNVRVLYPENFAKTIPPPPPPIHCKLTQNWIQFFSNKTLDCDRRENCFGWKASIRASFINICEGNDTGSFDLIYFQRFILFVPAQFNRFARNSLAADGARSPLGTAKQQKRKESNIIL